MNNQDRLLREARRVVRNTMTLRELREVRTPWHVLDELWIGVRQSDLKSLKAITEIVASEKKADAE